MHQRFVRTQRVERREVRLVGREIADAIEGPRGDAEAVVHREIVGVEVARLVQVAQVRALHVEAHRRHRSLAGREVSEERRQDELDRARFRGQPGHAGDVEVRGLRTHEKIGVEIDRRIHPTRAVQPDRDGCACLRPRVGVHAQRQRHVLIARQEHLAHGNRLERFLGDLAQHGRRVEPHLGPFGGSDRRGARIAVVAEHVVQRRQEVGEAEPLHDDAVDAWDVSLDRMRAFDAHDGPNADGRIDGGPEMELVRSVRLALGSDNSAQWGRRLRHSRLL